MTHSTKWWAGQIIAIFSGVYLALDGHGFGVGFFAFALLGILVDIRENTGEAK